MPGHDVPLALQLAPDIAEVLPLGRLREEPVQVDNGFLADLDHRESVLPIDRGYLRHQEGRRPAIVPAEVHKTGDRVPEIILRSHRVPEGQGDVGNSPVRDE